MAIQIHINLLTDLRHILRRTLNNLGQSFDESTYLKDLIYAYIELERYAVHPRIRKAIFSREMLEAEDNEKIQHIVQISESGGDLSGFLSRNAESLEISDMLLFDWNIKHFHLDNYKKSNGEKRSSELVFFVEKDNELRFIKISTHGRFSDIELIKIVDRNWPKEVGSLNGVLGDENPTMNELKDLRKSGIQALISRDDKTVMFPLGGGYSTAGTSVKIQMQSDYIIKQVKAFESDCRKEILLHLKKQKISSSQIVHGFLSFSELGHMILTTTTVLNLEITGPRIL